LGEAGTLGAGLGLGRVHGGGTGLAVHTALVILGANG